MSINLGINYSIEEFSGVLNQQKKFDLPAYQELRITGIDSEACQKPMKVAPELKLQEIKKIFNLFLEGQNLQVDTLSLKGALVYRVIEPGVISIVSDHPLHLKTRPEDSKNIFIQFRSYILEKIFQFLPSRHLILTDLSSQDTELLMDATLTRGELRSRIEKVSPRIFKRWVTDLSQIERKELVKIMDQRNSGKSLNSYGRTLLIKMEHINELPISYTQKDARRLTLLRLIKKVAVLIEILFFWMGFLTVGKSCALFKKSFLPQTPTNRCSASQLSNIIRREKNKHPDQIVNLKAVLEERGYPAVISGGHFSFRNEFCSVNLEGMTFVDCKFDWSHFSHATLNDVTFHSCKLLNTSFMNANIKSSSFIHCHMREAMFTNAQLEDVQFVSSSVVGSSFEDARIVNTVFDNVRMGATHFFQAQVEESRFVESCIRDTVFFGTLNDFDVDAVTRESATVSAPVVALLVHPEERGVSTPKVYLKLGQVAHVIPIRITGRNQQVNVEGVNREVTEILDAIGLNDREQLPIPQQLLQRILENPEEFPESARILKKTQLLTSEVDAFFLPGGEDLPPRLYGQQPAAATIWGDDYRRSLLELGMIRQAESKGIPLMGLCRGFQIANVYFGAELEQHVPGQMGVQRFTPLQGEQPGIYDAVIRNSVDSVAFHHQAVPQDRGPTQALRPSVIYQNWIKASERVDSNTAPMILFQFHPEFYNAPTAESIHREVVDQGLNRAMSPANQHFWKMLSDSAQVRYAKRQLRSALNYRLQALNAIVAAAPAEEIL